MLKHFTIIVMLFCLWNLQSKADEPEEQEVEKPKVEKLVPPWEDKEKFKAEYKDSKIVKYTLTTDMLTGSEEWRIEITYPEDQRVPPLRALRLPTDCYKYLLAKHKQTEMFKSRTLIVKLFTGGFNMTYEGTTADGTIGGETLYGMVETMPKPKIEIVRKKPKPEPGVQF